MVNLQSKKANSLESIAPASVASQEVKNNSIFSTELLINGELGKKPPIIVCGLPRSGSSLLSDLLTQTGAYYVFDDLYLKRKVDELGLDGPLDSSELSKLLDFLGWQIKARIRFKPYSTPMMLQEDVEKMNSSILAAFSGVQVDWTLLQKEWLIRLAKLNGCDGWGFNYPAAIRNLNYYDNMYPSSLFVFLHRSPDQVMSSYKYMPKGHNDGDPNRYHPIVYAFYWKVASRNYFKFKDENPNRIVEVKFSNMINQPEKEINVIAAAFDFSFNKSFKLVEANSSFGKKKKMINGLELLLLRSVAGKYIEKFEYKLPSKSLKLSDIFNLLITSLRFTVFKIKSRLG